MLEERFLVSVGHSIKTSNVPLALKDAGIFIFESRSSNPQSQVFKKSITPPSCLAASESHIFAAQNEKAVVHVYDRDKGNQEATVPFTERISAIALACADAVLILGTVEGRIFAWEICTGRLIVTGQSHLQAVTCLAVDANSEFLLSGSDDSTIHVWSLPDLLSFSRTIDASPMRTFASHRAEVTALNLGHGAFACNYAISTSKDQTCLVWNYRTGDLLRTYLLPQIAISLALDPADRAAYVGYIDGSLQQLDLYTSASGVRDAVQNGVQSTQAIQPSTSLRWKSPEASTGAASALSVSFDGNSIISGHSSGTVLAWEVARGSTSSTQVFAPLPGPVTNLTFLPVNGFAASTRKTPFSTPEIVKPRFGAPGRVGHEEAPGVEYAPAMPQLIPLHHRDGWSTFQEALRASSFSSQLLDEGLCELASWGKSALRQTNGNISQDDDFMALDDGSNRAQKATVDEENANLRLQLEALRRVQRKSFEKMESLTERNKALTRRSQKDHAKQNGTVINGALSAELSESNSSD